MRKGKDKYNTYIYINMQRSDLTKPAPFRGFGDFPTLGKHASHSEPNRVPQLGLQTPSVHSNVFHPAANANATYPFFCGAYANEWQKGFAEGMCMFVNMQQNKSFAGSRGTLTGRHTSHNILASVPVLNFYLTIGSCENQFVEQFVKRYSLNEALIPHEPTNEELRDSLGYPELIDANGDEEAGKEKEVQEARDTEFIKDFMRKWRFMGVILTDMDTASNYQKLFNLNVRGRSRVFNTWTTRLDSKYSRAQARDRVMKNDKLYLVLKKVKIDELTYKQPDGASMALTPPCREDGYIWQLRCARSSLTQHPRPYDERKGVQKYIYVGKVLNAVAKKADEHYQRRALREHTQMCCLPMIEIALATGQV